MQNLQDLSKMHVGYNKSRPLGNILSLGKICPCKMVIIGIESFVLPGKDNTRRVYFTTKHDSPLIFLCVR